MAPTPGCRRGKGDRTRCDARDAEHLDAFIDDLVIGRLSRPDAAIVLGGADPAETDALRARQTALRARLDELGTMFAAGDIDGGQLKAGSESLRVQLGEVDQRLADARTAESLADQVLTGDDLRAAWRRCPPDVRGKVISALMTVTVLPAPRGDARAAATSTPTGSASSGSG